MKKYSITMAVIIYSFFSLTTLFVWKAKQINTVTGDEPHYLVMSSGIIEHGSIEQTIPYKEEFKARKIFKPGLSTKDAQPSPENTHAILGPNGLYNVHNIGLPILLGLPFLIGGVVGAKLFMILLGAFVVVWAWKFSAFFSQRKTHIFWVVISMTIALPLLPASNQIYPDILAGLIALIGLYWFLTVHEQRTHTHEFFLATIIVYMPWLQIKFAATCVVLVLAIAAKIYLKSKDLKKAARICLLAGTSCAMLAAYNHYAFGRISGPYQANALEISKTSLMVLLGLHFDQNQGLLIQNPLNIIGILAIGWIYRFNRPFALIWGLVYLSLIVPNALHTNWYGGWSFSGRFGWAAAIVFFVPTIYGLLEIGKTKGKMLLILVAGGLLLQLYFFYHYTIVGTSLYNKGPENGIDAYSNYFYPLHSWLPALYNSKWAFWHVPNYAWLILMITILSAGFLRRIHIKQTSSIMIVSSIVLVAFSGLFGNRDAYPNKDFNPSQLPSQTGKTLELTRIAEQGIDKAGFVNFGPYLPLRYGNYEAVLTYSSIGKKTETLGLFDVYDATSHKQLGLMSIQGTNNAGGVLKIKFKVGQLENHLFEFRTYWNGNANLQVQQITLKKMIYGIKAHK